jgi:diguanylate cyclase (GGDEF)-like protein
VRQEIPGKPALDRLADENGVAIALVDETAREVYVANNNSICRELNPSGEFETHCKAFCGTAFEEVSETGGTVSFTCHAGLDCRVVPIEGGERPLVAIVGRTFLKAENYRRATTRAISGDWKGHSPSEFFENVLLSGSSSVLERTAAKLVGSSKKLKAVNGEHKLKEVEEIEKPHTVEPIPLETEKRSTTQPVSNIVARFSKEVGFGRDAERALPQADKPKTEDALVDAKVDHRFNKPKFEPPVLIHEQRVDPVAESGPIAVAPEPVPAEPPEITKPRSNEQRAAEARAWRSFFGSLLKTDHAKAVDSVLEFISLQYGLSALIWLERNDRKLVNTAAFGEMKNRKLRLGIAADDARLVEAARNEMPLELAEKPKEGAAQGRVMNLFPIGVGGEISAGVAIFGKIEDERVRRQIARFCQSIAPQMEILRLRGDVARGETLSTAVRRFSESLRQIDAEDVWIQLTQNAAEMLKAERASLMILNERSGALELKALIGGLGQPGKDDIVGERVARLVFDKNKSIIVPDVAKTGLPPVAASRSYKTPSFMSCPLSISGKAIGVMSFADKPSGQPFDRGSLSMFQAIAPQIAVAIDRSSLKEKAGEFEQLSVTDALTGLLNRRYIEARLAEEVKRSNRHGFPMSFMMIDVDHFKSYNDQFGHPAGDEALKLVGHVIRETLRGADVAARFGGEEFSILLPQTGPEEAWAIGERVRHNIAETVFPHRVVTASIGIASCSADLCSVVHIVAAADKALYEAKRRGRNRIMAFEQI